MPKGANGTSEPRYFAAASELIAWFDGNHHVERELWVGYYKRDSGRPSITWPESVDAALCFGWIDGVRKSVDAIRYVIRFTPRKPSSIWSAVNIERVRVLTEKGMMRPAGLAAFDRRRDDRSSVYAYEQRKTATLTPAEARSFRANKTAWKWFSTQAPSYQRTAAYWVISAKKAETRARRLATLIDDSSRGDRIAPLRVRPGKR
jgi:uncharacterized protein YdeI (YjbR/CyaY-like superfamily)